MGKEFWIKLGKNIKTQGPFTQEKLLSYVREGRLKPEMLISTDGKTFVPASSLQGVVWPAMTLDVSALSSDVPYESQKSPMPMSVPGSAITTQGTNTGFKKTSAAPPAPVVHAIPIEEFKECIFCAEEIKANARLCRFCGKEQVKSSTLRRRSGRIQRYNPHGSFVPQGKSFVNSAIFAMVLYWFAWLPGLIANIIWWNEACKIEYATGRTPEGKGCLVALFWVMGVGLIVVSFLFWLIFVLWAVG